MQLRDYQDAISTRAAELLEQFKIAYLCMEMRTGKTLTAFAAAEKYGAKTYLFVTKKKAIGSIESDAEGIETTLTGLVTNYEQLHNVEPGNYDIVILDEAQCIGQYPVPAERTKRLKVLCEGKPIIYLSGTPSPESYSQLFYQFWVSSFSPFKEYKNFYAWANAGFVHIKKKYVYNRELNDYSKADKAKIEAATQHLFISYSQQEAGFAQTVDEEVIYLRMKKPTYVLAEKLIRDRVYTGKDGQVILADTEVKLLQKLWQIYTGSVICEDKTGIIFDNSKVSFIKEHFAGKKIAVFYVFKAERLMLIAAFGYNKLTESPEEFNTSTDKIFISQIQSGSMGVNLSTADALVMMNIHYSNVLYWQARARLQSKDRNEPAKVYWIFSEDGLERRIYEAVQAKRDYVLKYFKKDIASLVQKEGDQFKIQKGNVTIYADTVTEVVAKSEMYEAIEKDPGLIGKILEQATLNLKA